VLAGRGRLGRLGFLRAAREDRAKVYACGHRPCGDSVDRDAQVLVALERVDYLTTRHLWKPNVLLANEAEWTPMMTPTILRHLTELRQRTSSLALR
jgi:hypothetical protein